MHKPLETGAINPALMDESAEIEIDPGSPTPDSDSPPQEPSNKPEGRWWKLERPSRSQLAIGVGYVISLATALVIAVRVVDDNPKLAIGMLAVVFVLCQAAIDLAHFSGKSTSKGVFSAVVRLAAVFIALLFI